MTESELFNSASELEQGLEYIRQSPATNGTVEMIVCRPQVGERRVLESAQLDLERGLVGDNWLQRGNRKTADGSANPDMQLNLMNARAIALIAGSQERWPLAGDQFFIDLDLSEENLPPGSRLRIGSALIEITAEPHLGCKKFSERFGRDATLFVNSDIGRSLHLRGLNAKVVEAGEVRSRDSVVKL